MTTSWTAALDEHELVLRAYLAHAVAVPGAKWTVARAPGKWSTADLTLHLALAYESGIPDGPGPAMRLVSSPASAWLARTFYLPLMFATRTFPRNAPAPREVRPDSIIASTTPRGELLARLDASAAATARALRAAADTRPQVRIMHAYFGALTPLPALRLLSAHTRHHTAIATTFS